MGLFFVAFVEYPVVCSLGFVSMFPVASNSQLQLLFAINSYHLSFSRLQSFLRRKRPGQVNHFLAALFDCLAAGLVNWDGPHFSLSPSGAAILDIALLVRNAGIHNQTDYRFVDGGLVFAPSETSLSAVTTARVPVSV